MSSTRASTNAGPSASSSRGPNPLTQPLPPTARTTRSTRSQTIVRHPSTASTSTRPAGRRVEATKARGPRVAAEAPGEGSVSAGSSSAATKGKGRASLQQTDSPGGSGRPKKTVRRSKEDGGELGVFLDPPSAQSTSGRRPSRCNLSKPTLPPSNENIHFLPDPVQDDDDDDDFNIQPSPIKKQFFSRPASPPPPVPRPIDAPLSPSRRINPGVKRPRVRAFDDQPQVPAFKFPRPEGPPALQIDSSSNPFYVPPPPRLISPPQLSTNDGMDPIPASPTKLRTSSSETLKLASPPPLPLALTKKRYRTDSPAATPLKSCLSSSPSHPSSDDARMASADNTPKKNKRVKLTPPGADTPSAAASYHLEDPTASRPPPAVFDPTRSPPRAPSVTDLNLLAKKFKSPRKKIVNREDVDGRDGALAVKDFLGVTPARPESSGPSQPGDNTNNLVAPPLDRGGIRVPGLRLPTATPSRIPQPISATSIARPRLGATAPTLSSLAKMAPPIASSSRTPVPPVRRLPAYPSTLGGRPTSAATSRPVAPLPSARKTSVPLPPALAPVVRPPSPRTVSAPLPAEKGQGLSAEGQTALQTLRASLAKLSVRRTSGGDDKPRRISGLPTVSRSSLSSAASTSKAIMGPPALPPPLVGRRSSSQPGPPPAPSAAVARRVSSQPAASTSSTTLDGLSEAGPSVSLTDSKSRASLASIAVGTQPCTTLKGIVAFVDVRTAEGDEAGGVFVEMLKGLGAKVRLLERQFPASARLTDAHSTPPGSHPTDRLGDPHHLQGWQADDAQLLPPVAARRCRPDRGGRRRGRDGRLDRQHVDRLDRVNDVEQASEGTGRARWDWVGDSVSGGEGKGRRGGVSGRPGRPDGLRKGAISHTSPSSRSTDFPAHSTCFACLSTRSAANRCSPGTCSPRRTTLTRPL